MPYILVFVLAIVIVSAVFAPLTVAQSTTTPYYVFRNGEWIEVPAPTTSPPTYDPSTQFPYWDGVSWSLIPPPTLGPVWAGTGWANGNVAPFETGPMYFDSSLPEGQVYVWTGTEYVVADAATLQNAPAPQEYVVWDDSLGQWTLGPNPPWWWPPPVNPNCYAGGNPDLIIEKITTTPFPPKLGWVPIEIYVKNVGGAYADATKTRLITDEIINPIKFLDTPGIDCGMNAKITYNYFFGDDQQHAFSAWADDNDDLAETFQGELNNNLQAAIIAVGADLSINAQDVKITEIPAGAPNNLFGVMALQFDITIHNQGTDDLVVPAGIVLPIADVNNGAEVDPFGAFVAQGANRGTAFIGNNIPIGGQQIVSVQIPAPALNAAGDNYFYPVHVKNPLGFLELGYLNNDVLAVYKGPDLVPEAIDVTGQRSDENKTLSLNLKIRVNGNANIGRNNANQQWGVFGVIVDSPGSLTGQQRLIYSIPVGVTLVPGDLIILGVQIGYPAAGNYDVKATVDDFDIVKETDESNNVLVQEITVN